MRFITSVAGYRRKDKKRNSEIRQEFNIMDSNSKIKDIAQSMDPDRLPRKATEYRPKRRWSIERRTKRWKDELDSLQPEQTWRRKKMMNALYNRRSSDTMRVLHYEFI
jgi:hypothetical protein